MIVPHIIQVPDGTTVHETGTQLYYSKSDRYPVVLLYIRQVLDGTTIHQLGTQWYYSITDRYPVILAYSRQVPGGTSVHQTSTWWYYSTSGEYPVYIRQIVGGTTVHQNRYLMVPPYIRQVPSGTIINQKGTQWYCCTSEQVSGTSEASQRKNRYLYHVLYIRGFFEQLRGVVQHYDVPTTYVKPNNTRRQLLGRSKDKVVGLVYHIQCDACDATYVG